MGAASNNSFYVTIVIYSACVLRFIMLNFEEELKKFEPSMEIEQIEDVVYNHALTDMTDIMLEMLNKEKENEMLLMREPLE